MEDIFQALKENDCPSRIFYPAKLSLAIEGEMKNFHKKKTKGIHDHQSST
jgi:hypothetical protein